MLDSGAVEAASGANAIDQGNTSQAGHPHARGCGIGDTHLAEADDITTLMITIAHDVGSVLECQFQLLFGHGRLMKVVTGSFPYLSVDQLRNRRKVIIHAAIHDLDVESMLTGKEADTRSAIQKIIDYLSGNLFRRLADVLVGDTMVGRINHVDWMAQ